MLISSSKEMKKVIAFAERIAKFPVNVLILGETGSGKELIARHIHKTSKSVGKFVSINCTAVPHELLESELFGYNKGAFTGAYTAKKGIMLEARGGSLLLDEIGDMPLNLQPKLLRVLDNKRFTPLGSTESIDFNARIIATTNKSESLLDEKVFRPDLYFRLSTTIINIPPLRERPNDIISLTNYFLGKIQEEFGLKNFPMIKSSKIYRLLLKYTWPGNIRELQNVLKRSIIKGNGILKPEILANTINETPIILHSNKHLKTNGIFIWDVNKNGTNIKKAKSCIEEYIINYLVNYIKNVERKKILKKDLARRLGISITTLLNKLDTKETKEKENKK